MYKILSIAGSDCSGGAGIQADLKTIAAYKMYGMTVITALTAQNTCGVSAVHDIPPEFVGQQLDAVFTDIRPDAVKIGMVSNASIIEVIAEKLLQYKMKCIVVDPVMAATSGSLLIKENAVQTLIEKLFPIASLITPNIPEAEIICRRKILTKQDMADCALEMYRRFRTTVLIKGGHLSDCADDFLLSAEGGQWFDGKKIQTKNTHGTGCTLSSAIACGLGSGLSSASAVERAKQYISGALASGLDLGSGSGPVDHGWNNSIIK